MEYVKAFDNQDDIFNLLHSLWTQKRLILLITLFSFLTGLTYIGFAKPKYEFKLNISLPNDLDGASLKYNMLAEKFLVNLDAQTIYKIFTRVFMSETTRNVFMKQITHEGLQSEARNKLLYSNKLIIKVVPRTNPEQYLLVLKGSNPEMLADLGMKYVYFSKKLAIKELTENMAYRKQEILDVIQLEINKARAVAKQQKLDRLVKLNEALRIAEATGLTEQVSAIAAKIVPQGDKQDEPGFMYNRGSKALIAEIKNLNQRKSDDAFSPGLRQLQAEFDLYKNMTINLEQFRMFNLDGSLLPPDLVPIELPKNMIIILSVIFGLALGVFSIMLKNFLKMNSSVRH